MVSVSPVAVWDPVSQNDPGQKKKATRRMPDRFASLVEPEPGSGYTHAPGSSLPGPNPVNRIVR
jgi:hypothetical protein